MRLLALALAALSFAAQGAELDDRTSGYSGYSGYERESIAQVLAARGQRLDPDPEGKRIEAVDVVSLDVIEPRDPAPRILNVLHWKTQPHVLAREVLLAPGDTYRQALVDETARNLRGLIQLSLVVVLPVMGSTPDAVRILVLTKDVWSLRVNTDVRFVGGKLESLTIQPNERNLAGLHHVVAAELDLTPLSMALGASYSVPRLFGSRVALDVSATGILYRPDGHLEGSSGGVSVGLPLWSTLAEWSWGASVGWSNAVARRYVDAELALFRASTGGTIPFEYRSAVTTGDAFVTRSYGQGIKVDLTSGVSASRRNYVVRDAADPQTVAEFTARALPRSDTRLTPYAQVRSYDTRFARVLDVETLGLQEDFRLGHDVLLRVYPAAAALGSTRSFVGLNAAAQYTLEFAGDGLSRTSLETVLEGDADALADAVVEGRARLVSPRLFLGRVVLDAREVWRPRNSLNRISFLGGEGRLRGFPTSFEFGRHVVSANLELRTRPLEVLSCELGGAAFVDVGDAFDRFDAIRWKAGTGLGLRILFPQLNRLVFRADLGVPVVGRDEPGVHPFELVLTFEQAFAVPVLRSSSIFTAR